MKNQYTFLVLFSLIAYATAAQNISIDSNYATNGYASGATNGRFVNESVMLSGNEVIVAGNPGSNTSYYVEKYLDTGFRDPSFGTNGSGFVLININANSKDNANALKVQPDGKILIAGTSDSNPSLFGTYWDVFVSRLMPDGSLDPNFGTNGHVKTDLGTDDDEVWEVAVNSLGEIYVLAATQSTTVDTKLLKYDSNGILDTTYGINGVLDVPVPADSRFYEFVINSQDEIILSGTVLNSTTNEYEVTVLKLDGQGALVTSYGTNGIVTIADSLENYTTRDMIFTSDGGLLITGAAGSNSIDTQLALYKLTSTGTVDTNFNSNGVAYFDHGSSNYGVTFAYSILELPDGTFIAQADIIGNNNYDLLLLNVDATGQLVSSFANSGRYILPRSTHQDYNRQVLLQDDGKIIVVGMDTNSTTRRTMLVRFKDVFTLSQDSVYEPYVMIYPNPFSDSLKVNTNGKVSSLSLYNVLGQLISRRHHQDVIATSELGQGVYFLEVTQENGTISRHQLIKE